MNNLPFTSIGIIARNEEKNIMNTLSHLINQDYPHESMEILIVDGNSTDKTREIARDFLDKSNIQYLIINEKDCTNKNHGKNYWHSFARNCLIDALDIRSKYLAWIDADCRADTDWLSTLVEIMEKNTDPKIIWAGGRRLVESEGGISKKELMLNYYFTSKIMSLGNPAFTKSDAKYIPSIAGYNSIYTTEILKQYRYNTLYAFNTDDIEINYRLVRDGYRFLNVPWARIWHRMNDSIIVFLKQMMKYGQWAINTSKIHKKIVRIYIPISIIYIVGMVLTPIFLYLGWSIGLFTKFNWLMIIFLSFIVTIENIRQTKSIQSFWVMMIVPLHPLMYGMGVIWIWLKKSYQILWYLWPIEYKNSGITLYNITYKHILEKRFDVKERWIYANPVSIRRIWIQYIWTPIELLFQINKIKIFPDEWWLIIIVLFRIKNAICVVHDIRNFKYSTKQQSFIQKIYYSVISYWLKNIRKLQHIIVPSLTTKNKLMSQLNVDEERITVAYNIIDEDIFFPVQNEEKILKRNKLLNRYNIAISSETNILLYVGSEEDRKNVITLLKSLTKIKEKYICIKIGKPVIKKNRDLHKRYIQENNLSVSIIDNIETMEELADWYRIADVFIFPSIFEGFWRTPVEAQACWCPVITTKCEGIAEVIWSSACIIDDPEDYNILWNEIKRVLLDSQFRKEIITAGIENAKKYTKTQNDSIWNNLLWNK